MSSTRTTNALVIAILVFVILLTFIILGVRIRT